MELVISCILFVLALVSVLGFIGYGGWPRDEATPRR
jgi:hypothetical protein